MAPAWKTSTSQTSLSIPLCTTGRLIPLLLKSFKCQQ